MGEGRTFAILANQFAQVFLNCCSCLLSYTGQQSLPNNTYVQKLKRMLFVPEILVGHVGIEFREQEVHCNFHTFLVDVNKHIPTTV